MRGNVHMRVGEVELALGAYREAVKLAPDSGEARQVLANALQESGDDAGAVAEYRKALEFSHEASETGIVTRRELAILLFHAGKPDEAKQLLREVLSQREDDVFTLNRLAEVHASLGEADEAGALLAAVRVRDPQNVPARLTQVRLSTAAKDWDGAQAALAELKTLRPGQPFVDYELAVVHAARGDLAASMTALESSLSGADSAARTKTQADPRLAALASDPRFLALTASGK